MSALLLAQLLGATLLGFLAGTSPHDEIVSEQLTTVEACEVPLTDLGRRASFSGSALYHLRTASDQSVAELTPIHRPSFFARFLEINRLERCAKRWRLQASSWYVLSFSAGTTGVALERWTIRVCGGRLPKSCLELVLPRG